MRALVAILLFSFSSTAFSQSINQDARSVSALRNLASLPLGFEQNLGQAASDVRFLSHAAGYSVYLSKGEMLLVFQDYNGHAKA